MKPMPITYVWTGEVLRPLARYHNIAIRQFGEVGTEHTLEPTSIRNMASHNHYYAALTEAYNNLPEHYALKYPSLDHFRYMLLIDAGFCEPDDVCVYVDADEAKRQADKAHKKNRFAIVSINDNVVVVRTAKSQDLSSMKKDEFEASKKAVLDLASSMVGVPLGELKRNAGRGA